MGAAMNVLGAFMQVGEGALNIMAQGQKRSSELGDLQADMKDAGREVSQANKAEVDAIERGQYAEGISRMKGSRLVAEQRVALARSGADTQSGTAAAVMADTRLMSEMDAQQIRNNAMREAWGHRQEAQTSGRRRDKLRQKYHDLEDSGTLSNLGSYMTETGKIAEASADAWGA